LSFSVGGFSFLSFSERSFHFISTTRYYRTLTKCTGFKTGVYISSQLRCEINLNNVRQVVCCDGKYFYWFSSHCSELKPHIRSSVRRYYQFR
jgi:hypothetical protein